MLSKISRHSILPLLLWAGVATLVVGFVMNSMWQHIPTGRVRESATLALIALVLAWIANRFSRIPIANLLALIWGCALLHFVGALPALAVAFFALSALALGSIIIPACYGRSVLLPTLIGTAFIVGVIGWLLPFPVHYRWVYVLALLLPIAWRRIELSARLKAAAETWRCMLADAPRTAAFAVMVIGIASSGCWMPTMQHDDLGYHLGMPTQLALLGYYRMDLFSQLWALAPWAGDIVQSIAQVLAAQEARGAVDAFWLITSAALVWRLSAVLELPAYACWLASALFASMPLTTSLVGGMQAELPATTVLLALALSVAAAPKQPDARVFCVVSAFAGLLLALKTGFIAATIPVGIWLLCRWHGRLLWKATLPAIALVVFIAGSSYVYAYVLSGNPLLPLFNGIFHSPFIPPENMFDTRYPPGGGLALLWQMTFHTSLYFECWNGAAGVSMLGLSGAFFAALFMPTLRPLALVAMAAFAIPLSTVNYFRYAYPALVLMAPVMVGATIALASQRNAALLLAALVTLNLLYQGCAYYTLYEGTFLRHGGPVKKRLFERLLPERLMAQYIRQQGTNDTALFCDILRPYSAELAGRAFTVSLYDTELNTAYFQAQDDPSGDTWRAMFARTGVRYAVTTESRRSAALSAAFSDAQKIKQIGEIELWLLPVASATSSLTKSRDVATARFRP